MRTNSRRRFWSLFDRWALCVVLVLQGVLLLLRWTSASGGGATSLPEGGRMDPAEVAAARPRSVVAATQVSFGGAPQRLPVSVESVVEQTSWSMLRNSPGLDVREASGGFELRLSVPPPNGREARAYVVGRRVDIEVPIRDAAGVPCSRLYRQVLLPTALDGSRSPRIQHTNGILRVFVYKP